MLRKRKKIKQPGSWKSKVWKIGGILLALFLLLDVYLLSDTKFLSVKSVNVLAEKVDCASSSELVDKSNLIGQNIFFLKKEPVANKLAQDFPCIKSVEISTKPPGKLDLKVVGRTPAAILELTKESTSSGIEASSSALLNFSKQSSGSFVVDDQGVVYSSNIENLSAPKLYINFSSLRIGQRIGDDIIQKTLRILGKLNTLNITVRDGKIYQQEVLSLDATPRLIFALDRPEDFQLASLQLILDKAKIEERELDYVDLRFDKSIIKYYPKK
jgi:hypothetical protein